MKPQKVKIEHDGDRWGAFYDIMALYRFSGWMWMAQARNYKLARKIAALVRKYEER